MTGLTKNLCNYHRSESTGKHGWFMCFIHEYYCFLNKQRSRAISVKQICFFYEQSFSLLLSICTCEVQQGVHPRASTLTHTESETVQMGWWQWPSLLLQRPPGRSRWCSVLRGKAPAQTSQQQLKQCTRCHSSREDKGICVTVALKWAGNVCLDCPSHLHPLPSSWELLSNRNYLTEMDRYSQVKDCFLLPRHGFFSIPK